MNAHVLHLYLTCGAVSSGEDEIAVDERAGWRAGLEGASE